MKQLLASLLLPLSALAAVSSAPLAAQQSQAATEPNPMYLSLREMALTIEASEIGVEPEALDQPYVAMFEMDFDGTPVTIAAFATGEASIYLGNGGGILGTAQESEAVAAAARRFVAGSEAYLDQLRPTETYPRPASGQTTFYLVTENGVYGGSASTDALADQQHDLSGLFYLGQDVITEIRLHEQSKQ